MNDLAHRLRRAVTEGIALAALGALGCGAPVIPTLDGGTFAADGGLHVQLNDDGGVGAGYPTDALLCHGPAFTSGYHGRCCATASCYTPTDGGSCAPYPPAEVGLPPGSGSCLCAIAENDARMVVGPFGPNPAHTPQKAGSCCYVFGSIGCDGRPLIVDGAVVTAPVVPRSDWA